MNDPAASSRVSDKGFHLKAVPSVTLDPNGNNFPTSKHYPGKRFFPVAHTASSHGA